MSLLPVFAYSAANRKAEKTYFLMRSGHASHEQATRAATRVFREAFHRYTQHL
ncbi:hypothetical protein [Hymenobacter latericus]|uniref:hypothetical protein n=1 Tax=Hymenobacter sp. YIM 151858-1 TaxID=2987688 RepID=UPI0022277C63|nr:hypothetical protein [Hymenobacter sp. YIM 151858-1]UYZ60103.1 hypothetical protein OIS50_04705 [Hymenobacter sp. YIM 151858-1]